MLNSTPYLVVNNPNASVSALTSFELIAPGNTSAGENNNWRFLIDAANAFLTQKLIAGAWTTADKKQKA